MLKQSIVEFNHESEPIWPAGILFLTKHFFCPQQIGPMVADSGSVFFEDLSDLGIQGYG